MTDVAGGGLGRDARDLKTGRALSTIADWSIAVKVHTPNARLRVGGNESQSNALVNNVLTFVEASRLNEKTRFENVNFGYAELNRPVQCSGRRFFDGNSGGMDDLGR